jgi:hypothetical protein
VPGLASFLHGLALSRWYGLSILTVGAAGLGMRLALAWAPMSWQINHLLPDDAFYYFQIARNIAHGHGATFDGHTVTNGYHPLWMAVLVPAFRVFPGETAIQAALTFAATLDAATALVVFAIARQLTSRRWLNLLALAFYALNPIVMMNSVNGLETSLSLFFVMLLTLWCVRTMKSAAPTASGCIAPAVIGGLAILARTDNACIFAAMLSALFVQHRLRALPFVLLSGAAAAAIVSPWLLWSVWRLGTPMQVSAEAQPYVWHASFQPLTGHASVLLLVRHSVGELVLDTLRLPRLYFGPSLVVAACGAGALVIAVQVGIGRVLRSTLPLTPVLAGIAMIFSIDALVRWHVRSWYFVDLIPLAGLALAVVVDRVLDRLAVAGASQDRSPAALAVVPAALVSVLMFVAAWLGAFDRGLASQGAYPQQGIMRDVARGLARRTQPGTRVAGFNAGILGFYYERETLNLDGVVNADALAALRRHDLAGYVRAQQVAYVLDFDSSVRGTFGRFWGTDLDALLGVDARIAASGDDRDPYVIYAVNPP